MSDSNPFVNVDKDVVKPEKPYTYADREYAKDLADSMKDLLLASIDDMQGILKNYDPSDVRIDTEIPKARGPNFPSKPILSSAELDDNWPTNYPSTPILLGYGNLDFSFVSPIPPDDINANFGWLGAIYTSEMYNALFARIYDNVINGGHGLTEAVYNSIIAMEQEARRINQEKTYRTSLDSVSETGFNLGSGILGGLQAETFRELSKLDQDSLNNITIKNFDMATENTKFFVNAGIELEKLLRATFEAFENRRLEASKFEKEIVVSVYAEHIKSYVSKWEGIKVQMQAFIAKIEAITSYNTAQVSVFEGLWSGIETQVKAIAAKNQAILDDRRNQIEIYKVEVDAVSQQWSTAIANAGLELEGVKLEVQLAIEQAKINLEAYTGESEVAKSIQDSIAKIAAQAMASALGIIHTSLSSSYSGSEAISENWSHGESISESHSYSEE